MTDPRPIPVQPDPKTRRVDPNPCPSQARYSMHMALPWDIPTLRAFSMKNFTRPDNIFCSPSLLLAYISCDTDPSRIPQKTDHYPIIQVLDIEHEVLEHKPVPMFRKADWSEYRKRLMGKLFQIERQERYETVEDVMYAFQELDNAIRETTQEVVELSKPLMHMKRAYGGTPRTTQSRSSAEAMAKYGAAVDKGKEQHWVEWQEKLMGPKSPNSRHADARGSGATRRLAATALCGRTGRMVFDDFASESFDIVNGLDQGDPHSGFAYALYNAFLVEIPRGEKKGEEGVVFVDDNTLVTVAHDFKGTHRKIRSVMQRKDGVEDWGNNHNATFSLPK
ncbi:hypothetical protein B0H13DRAFT_2384284 [Mycena leptocephala]|nr:hypothetical protein B0H13DRAFT_2384284 [Mycena leptocephala]